MGDALPTAEYGYVGPAFADKRFRCPTCGAVSPAILPDPWDDDFDPDADPDAVTCPVCNGRSVIGGTPPPPVGLGLTPFSRLTWARSDPADADALCEMNPVAAGWYVFRTALDGSDHRVRLTRDAETGWLWFTHPEGGGRVDVNPFDTGSDGGGSLGYWRGPLPAGGE